MRTFLAIDVKDRGVCAKIEDLQKSLLASGADLRPIHKSSLHFTLKFLGEISEEAAQSLWKRLSKLSFRSFRLSFKGVGVFPGPERISVVWIGVDREAADKLVTISDVVEEALTPLFPREKRPFKPHLTVARVRSGRNKSQLLEVIRANSETPFGEDGMESLKLKKSDLRPEGPIYTDLYVLPFKEDSVERHR